jgi:hypothetical protein
MAKHLLGVSCGEQFAGFGNFWNAKRGVNILCSFVFNPFPAHPGQRPSTLFAVVGEHDLMRFKARFRLPFEGAVNDLAHLVEPPIGAIQTPFTLCDAGATIRARQTQFQLFLIHHSQQTFRFVGVRLEGGGGHRLSNPLRLVEYF